MAKLGKAYEHDQLLKFFRLIELYFQCPPAYGPEDGLSMSDLSRLESAIIELLKFLMEVYEDI